MDLNFNDFQKQDVKFDINELQKVAKILVTMATKTFQDE